MKTASPHGTSRCQSRPRFIALLVAACFGAAAQANPTLPQVANGQATFSQQGNVFSITNTPNTIINWNSFSVAPGEVTRFIQQNATSSVLNRIVGQDPSRILGALQSNGRVFLINPNGIVFGRDARIDVGGLVASSLNLSNADFLAGRKHFSAGAFGAGVNNAGSIATPSGGQVFLVAPQVENSGIISAPNGDVVLAAGHTVRLADSSDPNLQVVVSAPADRAVNLGQVIAQGGRIGIYGALVNQRGALNANSAQLGENGKIVLRASADTLLEAGSTTSATGAGRGGSIQLLGQRVGLTGNAVVDASGAQGGGTVLVGGGYQGKDAQVANAQHTYLGQDASIRADAIARGAGGTVVLWGDVGTRAFGSISARGGAAGGDGGLVETSGHQLDVRGARVNAAAANGRNGTWLLDPLDIEVKTAGAATLGDVELFGNGNQGGFSLVDPALLNTAGTDVVLQAKNDILFTDNVSLPGSGHSLTALAGNNIAVNASIATNNGAITLSANDAGGTQTGTGTVTVNGSVASGSGTLRLSGASVDITGGGVLSANSAIELVGDSMSLAGTVAGGGAAGETYVSLMPATASRPITIGAATGGTLALTAGGLNTIDAYAVNLGSSSHTGGITVDGPTALSSMQKFVFETRGSIVINDTISMSMADSGLLAGVFGNAAITTGAGSALTAASVGLRADNMSLGGTISATSAVYLSPDTDGTQVKLGIGANDGAGVLGLFSSEVSSINTPKLAIGGGELALNTPITVFGQFDTGGNLFPSNGLLVLGAGSADISINAELGSTGGVALDSNGGAVFQSTSAPIGSTALYARGGSVDLQAANAVGVVAGRAISGDFKFKSFNGVHVTSVDGVGGITALGAIALTSDTNISQDSSAPLLGASLKLATPGTVTLTSTGNDVGALSATEVFSLDYRNLGALTIGVAGTGMTTRGTSSAPHVTVEAGGLLTVSQSVSAGTGAVNLAGTSVQVGNQVIEGNTGVATEGLGVSGGSVLLEALSAGSGKVSVSNGVAIGAPMIEIEADQIALESGATLNAGTGGAVHLMPANSARPVMLGTGALDSAAQLGLSQAELLTVDAGALYLGDSDLAGTVSVTGSLDLSTRANLGWTSIENASGDVTIDAPLHVGGTLSISSAGAIRGSGELRATSLYLGAVGGIGTSAAPLSTRASELAAGNTNSGGGTPINIRNNLGNAATLELMGAKQEGSGNTGSISIENTGELIVGVEAMVETGSGSISLVAHSPLRVRGSITTVSGSIALEAGSTGGTDDVLEIASGASVSSSSGNITLTAGDAITIVDPTSVSTTSGTITEQGTPTTPPTTTAPTLEACIIDPSLSGCGSVLPTLAVCLVSPSTAGCVAVLPSLDTCTAQPTTAGCAAVLPSLSVCTTAPATAGCSAVLPSLSVCTAAPTTAGCSAVLPSVDTCSVAPATAGCSVVLPSLSACIAAPTTAGCSAVLPSVSVCTTAPTTAGCSAVLPTLAVCVAAPATAGCAAVLPTLDSCIAAPATAGCSAVLPSIENCIGAPTAAGCSAVLPSLAVCVAAPATPGCSVVLPSLAVCMANPAGAGCAAVLPALAACVAAPATPGCAVVLPSLAVCVANPASAGCAVVLPSLSSCVATPTAAGCSVVLPALSTCIATPGTAGCTAVLPTLAQCTATPTLAGCSAVLPPIDACVANPSAPGCVVVVPPVDACVADPSLPACVIVTPTEPDAPLTQAISNTVNIINTATTSIATASTQPAGASATGGTGGPIAAVVASRSAGATDDTPEAKKDDTKTADAAATTKSEMKNEPAKKMYCN